ncbi:MAG: DNA-3-methyladenine glycosylase [Mycobacteriales bacterium]
MGGHWPAGTRLSNRPLPRRFYQRSSLDVARDLLGRDVVCESAEGVVRARLVEVEAYQGADDPGSHAFRGQTPRNATMFGPAGHLYVYFTYGMHWCANIVCGAVGVAEAVLLRAAVVTDGRDIAGSRRPASTARDLARGPARLTKAFGIDGSWDGTDIVRGSFRVLATPSIGGTVRTGPRVGVSGPGGPTPWRYWLDGVPEVSSYRPGVVRTRSGR